MYYRAGIEAGQAREKLKVAVHSLGFIAKDSQSAHEQFFPGYAKTFTQIGQERGWGGAVTRQSYESQADEMGALVVGNPEEVADKLYAIQSIGRIDRVSFTYERGSFIP